jgi:hypothetical protein
MAPERRAGARSPWLARLRRLVVATSFPPLLQLYRAVYWLALRLALRALRRSPAVKAVYLRGGLAQGRLLPGVSDIDLMLFAVGPPEGDASYVESYGRVASVFPMLDPLSMAPDPRYLQEHHDARPRLQYQFMDGQRSWKLLYGEDVLAGVRTRSGQDLALSFVCTAGVFTGLLVRNLWSAGGPQPDRVLAASVCYRCCATLLQMELSVAHGSFLASRDAALVEAERLLPEEVSFVEELRWLARCRFLRERPGLEDRAFGFVLRRARALARVLSATPCAGSAPGTPPAVRHEPDGSLAELGLTPVEGDLVARVIDAARSDWGVSYRAAYLAPTVFHSVGDLALALEVDPEQPPTLEQLLQVKRLFHGAPGLPGRQIFFYLLLPEVALHLGDEPFIWRTERYLIPAAHPDWFTLLCAGGFRLDGDGTPAPPPGFVSTAMLELLREAVWRVEHSGAIPGRPDPERLDPAAVFWKRLQVALVEASIPTGRVRYPVTPAAVERALAELGLPLPDTLAPLRDAVFDSTALLHARCGPSAAEEFVERVLDQLSSGFPPRTTPSGG